ncbi:PREDICTED: UPF0496 protein At3g57100-like [Tarenaya hassleriana]|uniref:UPF0496 protein At3g57100-like n=1 Tax=Tarenaya hassleriana TaxID=28532 RepID=UPI00053C4DD9|nr:PREDICTED: UPF0496 protein At3g57100-like [Tarenaya hassleriana]
MKKISSVRSRISVLAVLKRQTSSSPSLSSRVPNEPENSAGNNGIKILAMSHDSLNKLTGCVDDMNEDVGKLLLSSERDLPKNPNLFNLISDFFKTNTELSVLCEALKKCLEKAHRGETLVLGDLSDLMEEQRVSGGEGSFSKTLQNQRSFKKFSADDPFAGDFTRLFKNCHGDLVKMIEKLNQTTKKLNRKLRRVSIALLIAAVATVVISAVVIGVTVAPPVLAASGAAVSFVPMGSLGLFISSMWQKSRNVLKRQKAAISSMERGTCLALSEVAKITVLVNQLEDVVKSMEETMETAAEKNSLLKSAMKEVEKESSSRTKARSAFCNTKPGAMRMRI